MAMAVPKSASSTAAATPITSSLTPNNKATPKVVSATVAAHASTGGQKAIHFRGVRLEAREVREVERAVPQPEPAGDGRQERGAQREPRVPPSEGGAHAR
jgi:hypothetical protein